MQKFVNYFEFLLSVVFKRASLIIKKHVFHSYSKDKNLDFGDPLDFSDEK